MNKQESYDYIVECNTLTLKELALRFNTYVIEMRSLHSRFMAERNHQRTVRGYVDDRLNPHYHRYMFITSRMDILRVGVNMCLEELEQDNADNGDVSEEYIEEIQEEGLDDPSVREKSEKQLPDDSELVIDEDRGDEIDQCNVDVIENEECQLEDDFLNSKSLNYSSHVDVENCEGGTENMKIHSVLVDKFVSTVPRSYQILSVCVNSLYNVHTLDSCFKNALYYYASEHDQFYQVDTISLRGNVKCKSTTKLILTYGFGDEDLSLKFHDLDGDPIRDYLLHDREMCIMLVDTSLYKGVSARLSFEVGKNYVVDNYDEIVKSGKKKFFNMIFQSQSSVQFELEMFYGLGMWCCINEASLNSIYENSTKGRKKLKFINGLAELRIFRSHLDQCYKSKIKCDGNVDHIIVRHKRFQRICKRMIQNSDRTIEKLTNNLSYEVKLEYQQTNNNKRLRRYCKRYDKLA